MTGGENAFPFGDEFFIELFSRTKSNELEFLSINSQFAPLFQRWTGKYISANQNV
jgi:hypothetical protein